MLPQNHGLAIAALDPVGLPPASRAATATSDAGGPGEQA